MLCKLIFNFENLKKNIIYTKSLQVQNDCLLNSINFSRIDTNVFFNLFVNDEKIFTNDVNMKNFYFSTPLLLYNEKINKHDILSLMIYSDTEVEDKIQVILTLI